MAARARLSMLHGERLNSLTHLAGLGLALWGTVMLVQETRVLDSDWQAISCAVFGLSMVVLYGASTLYHSAHGAAKVLWAKVDHSAIYLLIAGTYTPFAWLTVQGRWDGWVLVLVWAFALWGMAQEWRSNTPATPPLRRYIAMGWLVLVAAVPLLYRLPGMGWIGLVSGGLLYTAGVPFYVNGARWRHAHGVWHLFVLAGTTAHYFTVLQCLPAA